MSRHRSAVMSVKTAAGEALATSRIIARHTPGGRERGVLPGPGLMTLDEVTRLAARYARDASTVYRHPAESGDVLDPSPASRLLTSAILCGVGFVIIGTVASDRP